LGSKVTQIIRSDLILKDFDTDIRTNVQEGMINHGIEILTESSINHIEKTPEGLKLTLSGTSEGTLIVDALLCATGRLPNLEKLALENAGVEIDQGSIAVSKDSRTSQPHIFAVGDCSNRINLTPIAIAEGRAFADTQFGHNPKAINYENVPSAVFSQPEAGTVGLTESQARAKFGDSIKCYTAKFRPMFHALTGADEKTFVKLIVETNTDRVLGVHMVGKDAGEIIQGMAIAVNMGATKKDFDATIGIHPSTAEEFVTLR
jgi:glutathione reductase (NADPH)